MDPDPAPGSGGMGRDMGRAMETEEGKRAAVNGQHIVAGGSQLNSDSSEDSSGQSEKGWLRYSTDSQPCQCKDTPVYCLVKLCNALGD